MNLTTLLVWIECSALKEMNFIKNMFTLKYSGLSVRQKLG